MAALVERPAGSATTAASQAAGGFERHRDLDALARAVRGFLAQLDGRVMEAIERIDVPTLIVVGANDEPFLPGSEVMAAKLPDTQLVVIDGAGHVANIDQPDAFNEASWASSASWPEPGRRRRPAARTARAAWAAPADYQGRFQGDQSNGS